MFYTNALASALCLLLGAAAAAPASALAAVSSVTNPSCNGTPSLCGRKYSNITQVGAHDSAFVGVLLPDNQDVNAATQLSNGIRFLQAQTHSFAGGIEMCHTSCLELDAGSLHDYLMPIKAFLDANQNEVVTLLLVNADSLPVAQYGAVFQQVGLDKYGFAPGANLALDQWPTLQEMIDSGKRLVTFMDFHADTSVVPFILDEFAYIYETPFDTTDATFNECTLDRPAGASADGRMGLMNHFLDFSLLSILIPNRLEAPKTNSEASIVAQADLCLQAHGRVPNFILLDFTTEGNPLAAQNALNGL